MDLVLTQTYDSCSVDTMPLCCGRLSVWVGRRPQTSALDLLALDCADYGHERGPLGAREQRHQSSGLPTAFAGANEIKSFRRKEH